MRQTRVVPQFVEYIPEHLEEGVLYVSRKYGTATHKCCCGCGEEVVTPLNPTDWSMKVEGWRVTLDPSIGNWSFACRSHYWIRRGHVVWAAPMAQWQIDRGRAFDRANKDAYFRVKNRENSPQHEESQVPRPVQAAEPPLVARLLHALKEWLR